MSEQFFIIGAQRAGTSYLYHQLAQHPMIEMAQPIKPEPKFFLQANIGDYSEADYRQKHYSATSQATVRGEKSTSYIESEKAAQAISTWYPDAKIIMILREPVARAISNYQFSANNKLETLPLEEAFFQEETRRDNYDKNKISASPYAYLKRGRYIDYIEMWQQFFPREQLLLLIHEETVGSAQKIQALYESLGVDTRFQAENIAEAQNTSEKIDYVPLSAEIKAYLRDYFAESNARLESYLQRAIPSWHMGNSDL